MTLRLYTFLINGARNNRSKHIEGGYDPTACPILYESLKNCYWLI